MNTEAESMNLPATVTVANQSEADARIPGALDMTKEAKRRVTWNPERDWDAPAKRKKPAIFEVESDLFETPLPMRTLRRLWDRMWECPHHDFKVWTRYPERLVRYFRKHASERGFGWTDIERSPMALGDHFHLDTMYYRNQCGWTGPGYACRHPKGGKGAEDTCSSCECPIAYSISDRKTLRKIGVAGDYEYDDEGYAEESTDWMELHTRPRDAMAGNVWLGFTAGDQEEFAVGAREFRRLRWNNPYVKLFADLSPLSGPIDFRFPYYETGDEANRSLWSPLEKQRFSHGGEETFVSFLDLVEVSGGSEPVHPDWVRSIRDQCQTAGISFAFESWGDWVHLSQSAECQAARDNGHNPGFYNFQCDRCMRQIVENRLDWTGRDCTCISVYKFGRERSGRTLDRKIHEGGTD